MHPHLIPCIRTWAQTRITIQKITSLSCFFFALPHSWIAPCKTASSGVKKSINQCFLCNRYQGYLRWHKENRHAIICCQCIFIHFRRFGEGIVSDLKSRLHAFVYSRCFKLYKFNKCVFFISKLKFWGVLYVVRSKGPPFDSDFPGVSGFILPSDVWLYYIPALYIESQTKIYLRLVMTKMLPAFEKKSNWFVKRENQSWWESNALKNVSNANEVESPAVGDRDRAKNSKSRLHSRPVVLRHESLQSLPTIKEPPEVTRTAPGNLTMNGDESSQSFGSRNENLRLCIKRWRKISLSKANASSIHFEVSIVIQKPRIT